MMSVPVVKQPLPSSGGGATGPVGGGPGAGPPSSQTPGKMVPPVPQPGSNTLPKSANPGNPIGVSMGGHSVPQPGGMSQNLPNSNLMKVSPQIPPSASAMPMSMVANHTASAQSMVHQALSGVGSTGTMAPLSLVQEHRAPSSVMPQPTPPVAHAHPTPPPPSSQRAPAPPAHSTSNPASHPPQTVPASSSNPSIGGNEKAKELVVGGKPTSNGVQMQKVGEASGISQQQMRKTSDGPVSLVVNHSAPETMGTSTSSNVSQQTQQSHSMSVSTTTGGLQPNLVKPDSSVANHAINQSAKPGLASASATNKVQPSPSPVKDKVPATPPKSVPSGSVSKPTNLSTTNDAASPVKSATTGQASANQGVPVKSPSTLSVTSPAKPATQPPAPAPAPTTEVGSSGSQPAGGSSDATLATSATPAKGSATTPVTEEVKANVISTPAKTLTDNESNDVKVTPAAAENESVASAHTLSLSEKEGKATIPLSSTPSRGSKRKRADIKPPAPTLGSSQAAAIAAAARTPNNKNKSQNDNSATIGSAKKDDKGDDDEEGEERKPKRVRIRTQPYQSPLPEMTYLPKFTRTPTPKAQEDRLILFYKNEFLAVRNAEGSFYVCQTMQNIYKHSARIRIRWLSQETTASNAEATKGQSTSEGEVYSPDFYDSIDFDCILTNLNLDRLERGKYRLPVVELERTQSILKRALDAEKGLAQKTPLTEEHPDGLDLSLYRDESQLKKRRSSRRKNSPRKGKSLEGKVGEAKQEENNESSSSSSSSSSSDEESEEEATRAKKPKRDKKAQPAKESTPAANPRARSGRESGKRRSGADSDAKTKSAPAVAKKRNSTPVRKRRSETPAAAAATPTPRATPARATRSPKSTPTPSRKERSRVKESRKKPGKKA